MFVYNVLCFRCCGNGQGHILTSFIIAQTNPFAMARTVAPTLHSNMLRYLQGWIGVVGLMALGNTISCFAGHQFLSDRLYTAAPSQGTLTQPGVAVSVLRAEPRLKLYSHRPRVACASF